MTNIELEDIKTIAELPYNWGKLNNKILLISGGTGFIGSFISNVIRYRNKVYGANIHIVSFSRHGGESNETVRKIAADITTPIHYDGQVDYILHLASNTHPTQYATDPVGTITTNIIGCNNLLKLAVEKKASRFLLASSVEVYGQGNDQPMDESYCGYIDCNKARSGYNESKRTCEALCQSYRQQYGIDAVIVRLSRIFGPDRKNDSKAIAQFMQKAVDGENIVLKSKGLQRFSYSYVADAASGILKVLLEGTNGEAYNISDDDEGKTLGDYASLMANLANRKVEFDLTEDKNANTITYSLMNTEKMKSIGWKPCYTVSDGLIRTYQIYKERLG